MMKFLNDLEQQKKEALKKLAVDFEMVDNLLVDLKKSNTEKDDTKNPTEQITTEDDHEIDEDHEKAKYSKGEHTRNFVFIFI